MAGGGDVAFLGQALQQGAQILAVLDGQAKMLADLALADAAGGIGDEAPNLFA
jgi:hypothetical protein